MTTPIPKDDSCGTLAVSPSTMIDSAGADAQVSESSSPIKNDSAVSASLSDIHGLQDATLHSPKSPITLQVGDRRFTVNVKTLTEGSQYFSAAFSGRWSLEKQPDGSYFIDQDGEVFEHILRYLRSNSTGDPVYPFFYNQAKGFDYATYQHILAQARYFDIPPLLEWIEGQKYLKAVQIERSTNILHRAEDASTTHYANVRLECYPIRRTKKVYVCPRGIDGHRGHQERCGRQCENAQPPDGKLYADEEVITFLEVQSKTVFKQSTLTDET